MKKLLIYSIIISAFIVTQVLGQEGQNPPKKIEIRKGFFPSYKVDGRKITTANELKHIILSIDDAEATQFFNKSMSLGNTAKPFSYVGGFLMGWAIGTSLGGGEFDTSLFASGGVIASIGILIAVKADQSRVKSVERYNSVLKDKWGISYRFSTYDTNLGIGLRYSF